MGSYKKSFRPTGRSDKIVEMNIFFRKQFKEGESQGITSAEMKVKSDPINLTKVNGKISFQRLHELQERVFPS